MIRLVCIELLCILFLFVGAPKAYSTIINAESCMFDHVREAIGIASEGDIVEVPAGKCAWSRKIVVNKGITISGAGISNTIVGPYAFDITDGTDNVRITGFTFDGNDNSPVSGTSPPFLIGDANASGCKNFRIDNCKFLNYTNSSPSFWYMIRINGFSYGVIDHCTFEDCGAEAIWIVSDTSKAWSRSQTVGQYNNGTVFIEDCTFTLTSDFTGTIRNAVDANAGARIVFRHNTMEDHASHTWGRFLEIHGACSRGSGPSVDASMRGVVSAEIYDNTFISNRSNPPNWYNIRGGRGVIYNNKLVGNWSGNILTMTNYRSSNRLCSQCESYIADGQCATCPEQGGKDDYPARDQINNLYIWNNTYGATGTEKTVSPVVDNSYCVPYHIQAGRDYFIEQMNGFEPYDYPHPLVVGSGPESLSPPTNLRIIDSN